MADYTVTTAFKGKDGVSPELGNMAAASSKFTKQAKKDFKSIGDVFKGTFASNVLSNAFTTGLSAVKRWGSGVLNSYMDFDSAINEAAVKFGGIDYGSEKFKELADVAREVGASTKFSAADAAGGLEALAGAGFAAENALKVLPSVANFAAAAGLDLATSAQISAEALNQFAMNSENAEIQATNLTKISDVLGKTAAATTATMSGLAEAVGYGAGSFTAAGQSLETFGAISGSLAGVGKHGSMAGTIMKRMIGGFTDLGATGKKALGKLGMETKDIVDENGNLMNVIDILEKMEAPLNALGSADRVKVLSDIFGEVAGPGVALMMNKGVKSIRELEGSLKDAGGTAKKAGDQLNLSLANRLGELGNAAEEVGYRIIENLLGDGRKGIDGLIESINKFDAKPIADGLKDAFDGAKWLFGLVKDNWGIVKALAGAFVAVKIGMAATNFIKWGMDLGSAVKGLAGKVTSIDSLGGSISKVNAVTGQSGAGLYTPQAPGAAPVKGAAGGVGAAGMAGAAISAVIVGWTVGTAISTKLEESGGRALKGQIMGENMINRFKDQFASGRMTTDQAKNLISSTAVMQKASKDDAMGILSPFKRFAAWYSGAEDPMFVYIERQKEINELYARLQKEMGFTAEQIRQLADAAMAGKNVANINVNVAGPGAGQVKTESSTTGASAPVVKVSQGGKN